MLIATLSSCFRLDTNPVGSGYINFSMQHNKQVWSNLLWIFLGVATNDIQIPSFRRGQLFTGTCNFNQLFLANRLVAVSFQKLSTTWYSPMQWNFQFLFCPFSSGLATVMSLFQALRMIPDAGYQPASVSFSGHVHRAYNVWKNL